MYIYYMKGRPKGSVNGKRKDGKKSGHMSKIWLKNWHLKKTYNITLDDYNEMFNKQEGKCIICSKHQSQLTSPLNVDHDHESGQIRELLCNTCNRAIGMLGDSVEILNSAKEYLEKHKQNK